MALQVSQDMFWVTTQLASVRDDDFVSKVVQLFGTRFKQAKAHSDEEKHAEAVLNIILQTIMPNSASYPATLEILGDYLVIP